MFNKRFITLTALAAVACAGVYAAPSGTFHPIRVIRGYPVSLTVKGIGDHVAVAKSNRPTANPRRTTLVHLADTSDLTPEAGPVAESVVLPTQTANPRRTTLVDLPTE